MNGIKRGATLELHEVTIPYERGEFKYICPWGDSHIGVIGTNYKAMDSSVKFIKEKDAKVILMGDLVDAINPNDKRFDPKTLDPRVSIDNVISDQYAILCEYIEKMDPSRIIGVHTGNHEETIRLNYSRNITYDLCRDYGLKYLGYSAWTRIIFKRPSHSEVFKMFSSHGYGGARYPATKQWKIQHIINALDDADLVLMGHVHDIQVGRIVKETIPTKGKLEVQQKTVGWMLTGSFLNKAEGVISYAEKLGLGSVKNGIATFKILPEERKIHVEC